LASDAVDPSNTVASVGTNILGSLSAASPLPGYAISDLGDKMLDEEVEPKYWFVE